MKNQWFNDRTTFMKQCYALSTECKSTKPYYESLYTFPFKLSTHTTVYETKSVMKAQLQLTALVREVYRHLTTIHASIAASLIHNSQISDYGLPS